MQLPYIQQQPPMLAHTQAVPCRMSKQPEDRVETAGPPHLYQRASKSLSHDGGLPPRTLPDAPLGSSSLQGACHKPWHFRVLNSTVARILGARERLPPLQCLTAQHA